MNVSLLHIAQVVAGGAALLSGLVMLLYPRLRKWRRSISPKTVRPWSEATRLMTALVLLMAGYHLVVWVFTPAGVGLQLPRDKWWIWLLAGVGAISLSVVLDGYESRTNDRPPGS